MELVELYLQMVLVPTTCEVGADTVAPKAAPSSDAGTRAQLSADVAAGVDELVPAEDETPVLVVLEELDELEQAAIASGSTTARAKRLKLTYRLEPRFLFIPEGYLRVNRNRLFSREKSLDRVSPL